MYMHVVTVWYGLSRMQHQMRTTRLHTGIYCATVSNSNVRFRPRPEARPQPISTKAHGSFEEITASVAILGRLREPMDGKARDHSKIGWYRLGTQRRHLVPTSKVVWTCQRAIA